MHSVKDAPPTTNQFLYEQDEIVFIFNRQELRNPAAFDGARIKPDHVLEGSQ
jgi:hypothetical protein